MSFRIASQSRRLLALATLAALAGSIIACSGGSSAPAPANPQASGNGNNGGSGNPSAGPIAAVREIWTPYVIPDTRTEPVLYEVVTTGRPASATLTIDGSDIALNDSGTGGDKLAGDGTWSVQLPVATILAKNTPDRVHRPQLGKLRLAGDNGLYNVVAEVWTAAMGLPAASPIAGGQETDYLVNYTASTEQLTRFDAEAWARSFYASHPDQYDFLNFVLVGGTRGNRYHGNLRNAVTGIGMGQLNAGAGFGSAARLMGYNVYPLSSMMDHGAKGFLHETGHQWISQLTTAPFGSGKPHWPKGSIATGIMGYSLPPTSQGGDFPYAFTPDGKGGYLVGPQSDGARTTFNMIELYMMGLAAAEEVPDYFVLRDQNLELKTGQLLSAADIQPVRVADIIAAAGQRTPGVASSQKAFRSATIILSERPLDAHALGLYDYFVRRGEARTELPCAEGAVGGLSCKPWYLATGGRSTMSLRIR